MFLMSAILQGCRPGEKNRTLIVGEPSKPVHKAISIAWRQMGGITYGLHHGHAVGELHYLIEHFMNFCIRQFICPNQEAQKAFENDVFIEPKWCFAKLICQHERPIKTHEK